MVRGKDEEVVRGLEQRRNGGGTETER
jgi:hypothetical protein